MLRNDILFENNDVIVCQKKANIAVETSKIGQKDMVSQIRSYLKSTTGDSYLGIIHRLDQPVEGIVVFAKNPKAAANLSKQIQEHTVLKKYLAVVSGKPDSNEAILIDYLLKDAKSNTSKVVEKNVKDAKKSELEYKVLKTIDDFSLVEITLKTGRHHQIRVQMQNIGCPLWGDVKYNEAFNGKKGVTVALCAYRLEFDNPTTGERMKFEIEPQNRAFKMFD